ncbi:MAG: carboxy terminal-processing peptidase [Opitutaceae bacterium]|nr:carboxy terminal-processing peptidase [Opitutaceae bacterium]
MPIRRLPARSLLPALVLAVLAALPTAAADRKFTTSPTLATEARVLVQLLSQAHYNRDAVRSSNYVEVVKDYMSGLDGQRMFFLKSDREKFERDYGTSLYWNVSRLGNIDAAYDIFYVYEKRAADRANWIFQNLDTAAAGLDTDEYFRLDRSKVEWPANAAEADHLWLNRLKFELIAELLNKKTPEEAKTTVRKRYERMLKNVAELEGSDVAELFLSTIGHLYDPHTTYLSGDTYEDFGIQMKLELVGIGAMLGLEDDYCVVREIVPGGPADLSKALKPNDKILAVGQKEGEPVEILGMKLRKIVDMIRGDKGTPVRLLIQPGDATDPSARKEISIVRDVVKLNSARAHAAIFQIPAKSGGTEPIGVINLPSFYGPSDEDGADAQSSASLDVAKLIGELKTAGIKGLVLDLRRNGGGLLSEAIDVAGLFIKNGPVVQVKNYAGDIQVNSDQNSAVAYDGPMAVLVDRFSASASEIVTGALQNYGRAIVVGDKSTHGKGSVQALEEMKRYVPQLAFSPLKTGAIKFTIQKYYLPNGNSTQLKGVVPDIVLPSLEDYLQIGEADLPHALAWDEIPSTLFDARPIPGVVLQTLQNDSLDRQKSLEEFSYLRRNVDRFKTRQEEKLVSLNLLIREKRQTEDEAFRKSLKDERAELAKQDYPSQEFRLGPVEPARLPTPANKDAKDPDDPDAVEDELLSTDENGFAKVDVHLKECLRIVGDAVALAQDKTQWADNSPPLALSSSDRG